MTNQTHQPPTHESLLKAMRPGAGYAVHTFGLKVGVAPAMLKPVLLEMLAAGKLSTFMRGKNTCFIVAGTEHLRRRHQVSPKPVVGPTRIALPRTASPFTGELTGYFAEINRRAALAMMVRPR
jgi:hypothetical protein